MSDELWRMSAVDAVMRLRNREISPLELVEASEGRVGSSLDKLVLYCFHYDSAEGRYAPVANRIMQLGGAVSLVIFAGFLTVLIRRDKKRTLVESTAK